MAFWIPPIWFGMQAGSGTPGRAPLFTDKDLSMPIHTRVMMILQDAIPDAQVWPDAIQTQHIDRDMICVQNLGSEWSISTTSWQRRRRNLLIYAYSTTSDGAERLMQKIALAVKRSPDIILSSAEDSDGGYVDEGKFFYRSMIVNIRGKL